MHVVAVDPGGTTGLIHWHYQGWEFLEIGPQEHHWELEQRLDSWSQGSHITIVCERFENRNDEFARLISNEYIGVVKCWHQKHKANSTLYLQGASQAKNWATDQKIEALGLNRRGLRRNSRDALRHFVYFVCNNKTQRHTPEHAEFMIKLKHMVEA